MSKDDNLSNAPSNDDSAYMSIVEYISQEHLNQYMDSFVPGDIYSPSLSAEGHTLFPSSVAEQGPIVLPSSAPEAGDFLFPEVTQSPVQTFSHSAGFVQQNSSAMRYPIQSGFENAQNTWSNQGTRSNTRNPGAGFINTNEISTWDRPQGYSTTTAPALNYADHGAAIDAQNSQQVPGKMKPAQSRPRVQVVRTHSSGPSVPPSARSDVSVGRHSNNQSPFMPRRISTADATVFDESVIMSPASTTQTSLNRGPASLDDFNEHSTTGSLISGTIIDDDRIEDTLDRNQEAIHATVEETAARSHSLYQALPLADDLYHCPYEAEECGHKPTKLKCNYDKYVDSHLKPFRCRQESCIDAQFSSTACLLRHEREAHGMHGHGEKPNLCSFPDCERSILGNGFPRRYNLFDHMKRVHNYDGATHVGRPVNRKRKTSDDSIPAEGRKKSKSRSASTAERAAQDRRQKEINLLNKQWNERFASFRNKVQNIKGPQDITSMQQSSEDMTAMQKLAQELHELG